MVFGFQYIVSLDRDGFGRYSYFLMEDKGVVDLVWGFGQEGKGFLEVEGSRVIFFRES